MAEGAPSTTAVIPAAGAGERLGSAEPKALVPVAGRPMLEWSLRAFAASPAVGAAIVAAPPGDEDRLGELARPFGARTVTGGASRSDSVAAALEHVETELVAVHDAARPLVTPDLIGALIERLAGRPDATGVIAAAPLTDTVKRAREPRDSRGEVPRGGPTIAATELRDHLWAAQTPQVLRTAALRQALEAREGPREATDDASLVEAQGGTVLIHPTPADNLKVTTPFDLRVAELLLLERE